jgi:predicted Zn finger-like uncharacterized protein
MRIECPNCKLTGQVSDINIPPEGRYMDCPRCKTNFFIQKKAAANWAETLSECPRCGFSTYSTERFDICPQCGLNAKVYHEQLRNQPTARKAEPTTKEPAAVDRETMRQELERLERKEAEKRQRRSESIAAPVLPGHLDELGPAVSLAPPPVRYLGWCFMAAASAVMAYGLKGWYGYWILKPAQVVMTRYEDVPGPYKLFIYYGLQPLVQMLLGLFGILATYQFLKMRPGARRLVEASAWSGVVFVVGSEVANMLGWVSRSSSSASFLYYLVGLTDSLLKAAFWSAPLLAAIWYLRRDVIRDEFPE